MTIGAGRLTDDRRHDGSVMVKFIKKPALNLEMQGAQPS